MRRDDEGVSTVVGALVILAILGMSLVYVNAFYVPAQGAALEVQGRDAMQDALAAARTGMLTDPASGAVRSFDIPLQPARGTPPLLSGIVLSPVSGSGTLSLDPARANVTISHVTTGTAVAGDPMRVGLAGGLVRVYDLGNATAPFSMGSLTLAPGSAYLAPVAYRLEGGTLLVDRGNASSVVQDPALSVTSAGSGIRVAWRIPVLAGPAAQVGGAASQATLSPGPLSSAGAGGAVLNVTITVQTDALGAWTAALRDVVGARGTVVALASGPLDNGTVTATIVSPGASPAVQLDLSLVRFETTLAMRAGG